MRKFPRAFSADCAFALYGPFTIAMLAALAWPGRLLAASLGPTPEGGPQAIPQTTAPQSDISTASTAPESQPVFEDYAFHGQVTLTEQFHPGFHSAYSGRNSLDSGRRGNETFDLTLYAGMRPWAGAEIWINPEVDQGFGLNNTVGLAGYSSGEAYKVGAAVPYVRVPRLFLRQTINLGGAVQPIAPDLNQLGGSETADRLVATIGKYSIGDIFDTNKFAHDPRNDFLNWAVIDAGTFDYAADAWGYSYGASLELYKAWWTLRAGVFDGSATPNSKFEELPLGRQLQALAEAEARYTMFGQPGKIKLLGFLTRAKLGRFSDLERYFAANPAASNVDAEVVRRLRNKVGASLNVEQPITAELGVFLRAGFSDGRTEAYDFTDIDRSVSGGLSLAGTSWGRPDDTVGAAYVVDGISKAHKDYLEQGGLGVLVGDGKLTSAGPEQILETFYSYAVRKGVNVSVDYQLVNHPAYNVDRGPVHIFGGRFHVQF